MISIIDINDVINSFNKVIQIFEKNVYVDDFVCKKIIFLFESDSYLWCDWKDDSICLSNWLLFTYYFVINLLYTYICLQSFIF